MKWSSFLYVFLGGGAGSLVRYGLSVAIQNRSTGSLPAATLAANAMACLIVAVWLKVFQGDGISEGVRLMILTGFCGGLSTFSTFSLETAQLIRQGEILWALINITLSVVLCTVVVIWALKK